MHITLETDYAVRIVDCLAQNAKRMGAKEISEKVHVTLRFSLKILRKLVSSGIVVSFKGAQGGYELGRPLENISLHDILASIEGNYVLNRCLKDGHVCKQSPDKRCPYHNTYNRISELVRGELQAVTFAKTADPSDTDKSNVRLVFK